MWIRVTDAADLDTIQTPAMQRHMPKAPRSSPSGRLRIMEAEPVRVQELTRQVQAKVIDFQVRNPNRISNNLAVVHVTDVAEVAITRMTAMPLNTLMAHTSPQSDVGAMVMIRHQVMSFGKISLAFSLFHHVYNVRG